MKKYFSVIPFVALSILASFINYVTYPLLARILPDTQFVDVIVALSLLTQISSFLTSIVALAIAYTKHDEDNAPKALEVLQSTLIRFFALLIIFLLVISPLVTSRLHLAPIFLVPIVLLLLFSIPVSVVSGFLNARQRMVQLGLVAAVTASTQFVFAISAAITTKNGAPTLIAMALGQLAGVIVLYVLLRREGLPRLSSIFARHQKEKRSGIVRYALLASAGIVVINILQILDLLIVKSFQVDQRLYTDLSIVSRLAFFSGTIFIWLFLGSIDVQKRQNNILLMAKLLTVFALIGVVAVVGVSIIGDEVVRVLTASGYPLATIRSIGIPAIIFKVLFLAHTSLVLYFIVLKSRLAVIYPGIVLIIFTLTAMLAINPSLGTLSIINRLNTAAVICLVIGLGLFMKSSLATNTQVKTSKMPGK